MKVGFLNTSLIFCDLCMFRLIADILQIAKIWAVTSDVISEIFQILKLGI